MKVLRMIKRFLIKKKNNPVIKGLLKMYQSLKNVRQTAAYCKKVKKINRERDRGKPMHIVFFVQLPSVWGKMERVFLEALTRKDIKVTLLAIPDEGMEQAENNQGKNETYAAMKSYGDMVKNAVTETGAWLDLKAMKPDYVFYPRPYDHYLPKQYQSDVVSCYAKVCYVPYGFLLTATCVEICLNRNFFQNCYYYFAENTIYAQYNRKRFKHSHKKGLRKSEALGYPIFADVLEAKNKTSDSWNRIDSDNKFRIIWAPRWTTDKHAGGTNFFAYKDRLIQFAKEHEEMAVVYRPHPLTFSNFLKTGEMTESQLENLRRSYDENDRMCIEEKADYLDTFWGSDVLLTDVSSVDIEYFITGKPVIYCYREAVELGEFAQQLYSVAYWAKDWNEVEQRLVQLQQGNDPLKEKRLQMVKDLLGDDFSSGAQKIVDELVNDYTGEMRG